jgi:hypothetical protein
MSRNKVLSLLPGLLLAGLLAGLSGCGLASGPGPASSSTPRGKPDSVSILIDEVSPSPTRQKPVVTLTVARLVQQLYATIYALPQMPENLGCTAELGPHYTLTFRQGSKTLVTVIAMRDGCRPVSIAGEGHDRQATATFWTQLDQAIYAATPPAQVEWFAIQHSLHPGQPPQTARITAASTAQRLYHAILALPLAPQGNIYADSSPAYQLVFHATDQAIPSVISQKLSLISLEGHFQSRGGTYVMNKAFKRLLGEILAGATFAPARPDAASLTLSRAGGAGQQTRIADAALLQRLYKKVYTLQRTRAQPNCPSEADKVAGKGTFYHYSFTQWDLPILQVDVYEGSCRLIEISPTGQFLQGNQEFWNLVHHAAGQ